MSGYFYRKVFSRRLNECLYNRLRNFQSLKNVLVVLRTYCPLRFKAFVGLIVDKLNAPLKSGPDLLKLTSKPRNNNGLLMLSGVAFQLWNTEGIGDEEIKNAIDEAKIVFNADENDKREDKAKKELKQDGWEPVILKDNFELWRRATRLSGIYQYKVFGSFTDISAQEWFTVQKDLDYRKTWDYLLIKLEVVEQEKKPFCPRDNVIDYGNEIIHWVMHYPFPMYSRDYCLVRRSMINYSENFMVLFSRAIDHPKCPPSDEFVRVRDYESYMVIRPHGAFYENGFDYVLTYFDNPQAAFPSPAYNWMAASGVPNFVETLHQAALNLKIRKESKNSRDSQEIESSFGSSYLSYFNYSSQKEKT